eukprot:m.242150 g.242150  ORF g.242150 m.242150 type:complete len:70 (-) comp30249_c0_seq1:176-385(-)
MQSQRHQADTMGSCQIIFMIKSDIYLGNSHACLEERGGRSGLVKLRGTRREGWKCDDADKTAILIRLIT